MYGPLSPRVSRQSASFHRFGSRREECEDQRQLNTFADWTREKSNEYFQALEVALVDRQPFQLFQQS